MEIFELQSLQKNKMVDFFRTQWGSTEMVISSGVYNCTQLEGFAVINEKEKIIGLITYVIENKECEIISLDSIEEGKSIGTLLVKRVEATALDNECKLVKLVTTNDNLRALKFYQKRNYTLSKILNNAVEHARKLKPEIPLVGEYDIPIRDEIELIKLIDEA